MAEIGPGGRWAITRDIKADPGGAMAVIEKEVYRSPCVSHNPGVPVYSKVELASLKKMPNSAELFRAVQRIKRIFTNARVVSTMVGQGGVDEHA